MAIDQTAPRKEKRLFKDGATYLWRWLLFGFIAAGLTPVFENTEQFWTIKLYQCLGGLPFGFLCWLIFTPLQNAFNAHRSRGKSWLFGVSAWLLAKAAFLGAFYL